MALLTDIVANNPKTEGDHTIWFSGLEISANLTAIYYIRKGDTGRMARPWELAILNTFNAAGLDFAFPTQTLLHEGCLHPDYDELYFGRSLYVLTHEQVRRRHSHGRARFWVALVATVVSGLALVRHLGSLKATPRSAHCAKWAGPFWPCKWGTILHDFQPVVHVLHSSQSAASHVRHQHLVGRFELFLEDRWVNLFRCIWALWAAFMPF